MTQENDWAKALDAIDVSALESLKRLKQEQDLLDERLKAMAAMKATVAAAVYQRVLDDYQARRRRLEDEAGPQKQAVRVEFAKLRDLLTRSQADHEMSKLDLQELELRHKLGEFDDKEYAKRSKAIESLVANKAAAHDRALALKMRFLEAVHSEMDLQSGAGSPADITERSMAAIPNAELAQSEARTDEVRVVDLPAASSNRTQVMPAVTVAKPSAATSEVTSQSTVMFRAARLVPQNPEAGKVSFTLNLKPTTIGSDSVNDVRIGGPGVDPKHAQITVSMAGFTLVDFTTKHGTRVNAEKIRERLLRHEDVIQIGAARFVFREG